jgi:hypothetical protein
MGAMKKFLPIVALAALSCCGGGESSRVEKVPEEIRRPRVVAPRVPDRHPFGDVTKVRPGQWATYKEGDRTFTVAAAAAAGDALWIELIEEGDPRLVSARLVRPDGVVQKAYYGEISKSGGKSTVEPQTLEQDSSTGGGAKESGREVDEETVTIAGKELKCRRISIRFEDLEGRLTRDVTLWNKDVPPVYAGSEHGGLVRRTTASSTVVLTGFGTDAKPLLELPK